MQSPRHISESGQKVGEGSTKPLGFTTPHYFYIYNISLDDFTAIPNYQSVYLLICIGVSVQIGSRILVFASMGQGLFKKKVPVRKHLANPSMTFGDL
jgi:hypothetical protein